MFFVFFLSSDDDDCFMCLKYAKLLQLCVEYVVT